MLSVNKAIADGQLIVTLVGMVDTMSSVALDREVGDVAGFSKVTFDMAGVTYVTSAGVRVLLGVGRRMSSGAELSLRNLQPMVRHIFELCGLNELVEGEKRGR